MGLQRRFWLAAGSAAAIGLVIGRLARGAPGGMPFAVPAVAVQTGHFEVEHTEAEWRKLLSPEQFEVLRQEGTERAFTSALNHEKRKGIFACAGCQLALFSSATKFDSGTGWPSFWQPLDHAVETTQDNSFGWKRTAVHCRRCGGHLGHVFDDGPQPTGLRYCMNGVALNFKPEGESS